MRTHSLKQVFIVDRFKALATNAIDDFHAADLKGVGVVESGAVVVNQKEGALLGDDGPLEACELVADTQRVAED